MEKERIKEMVARIIRFSGIPFIVRNIYARDKVTIIVYHNPPKDVFERHMQCLSKIYSFIGLNDLVYAINTQDFSRIPPKALVITFDDGNREGFDLTEVFERYKIRPTFYVCSNIINTNRKFWLMGSKF